jgi:hypothetical protein
VTATLELTQEFVDANSAEKLRSVTSSVLPAGTQLSTAMVDQGSQAGDLLGIALLTPRNPAGPAVNDEQRQTVLAALRETGFLAYPDGAAIGPATAAIVVTGGPLGDDAGNQGPTVARFAAAMAPHGSGVVVAGRDGSATGTAAVAVVRSDPGLNGLVSTVDDIDSESGRITAILGVQDLANGARPGQYGIGQGATSVTLAQ